MALWFSLGVGLLVMQIGAYLVPAVGTRDAMLAIVLGSCIGAGLLAWTARLGCESGLASAGLMHATYGSAFARLPGGAQHRAADRLDHLRDRDHARGHPGHRRARLSAGRSTAPLGTAADDAAVGRRAAGPAGRLDGQAGAPLREPLRPAAGGALAGRG